MTAQTEEIAAVLAERDRLRQALYVARDAMDDAAWAVRHSIYGKTIARERLAEGLAATAALDPRPANRERAEMAR